MQVLISSARRLGGALAGIVAVLALAAPITRATVPAGGSALYPAIVPSGGAGLGVAPTLPRRPRALRTPSHSARRVWMHAVTVTEYWPAPESRFIGKVVSAPGLIGEHRVDWLYSATGISMQGEGVGLDGQMYHLAAAGDGGWVTASGRRTSPSDGWAGGVPFWRAGAFWRNPLGAVTFPLHVGGWYAGASQGYVALPGVSFAPDASRSLQFYASIAVDPRVIPLGSRVFIPAYRNDGHRGWFIAQDTGGGIIGRHIDVYRSPLTSSRDSGHYLTGQRIYVIKPHS